MNYVPISFKTDYSLLKSLLKINNIIKYAKSCNSKYVGILDDNPYALMDFYDKCSQNGLKCIFGMIVKIGESVIYLYVQNYSGYLNIIKINELVKNGKLTFNDLIKFNDGLIVVLPYESYKICNRLKLSFKIYLGYKNDGELKNAQLISRDVLFINEILSLKKEDSVLLKILYKIAQEEYKGSNNYVLNATEFDKSTIESFQENIDLKFDFGKKYIPTFFKTENESKEYLRNLAYRGLKKRLNNTIPDVYIKRLKYELDVIESMGFTDYFLIVYDYVRFAKKNDIMVGPGRGSAAGSLVSFTLGITDIDPIKYELLFERFLNPERVTMPDIDIDFEDTRRMDVINYVRDKWGNKNVSLIVSYGTLGSKQVIRDVGKVMGIDTNLIDQLCKKIDPKKSLLENIKDGALLEFVKTNKLDKIYKISARLEGLKRHTTIHAAGVIISSLPLTEVIPTIDSNDGILAGYTMEYLERLGLIKMDFLALRNLTMMHNILKLITKKEPNFDIKKIPYDDKKTYELFKKGDTDNIFQFESAGMKNFLRKLEPSKFDDLVAANALFRPGPMDNIDEYIERRHNRKAITYLHRDLEPILKSTYGIIVYQEQIMQILSKMGGYSYAEADLIRRAMSKKKHDVMVNEKERFVKRAKEKGYDADTSSKVYDMIVKFANYGFNKSHSVAYARIGYEIAYLKANYKEMFQMNNLNMSIGSSSKIKDVIADAKMRGLKIIKPDINRSGYEYTIENDTLYLPLTSIKDISSNINKVIIDNAPYSDYFDFFKKVYGNSINKRVVETLISAGAFDSFNKSRNTMIENIDSAITYLDLIKNLDESLVMKPEIIESMKEDLPINEIEIFGFYITSHPSSKYTNVVKIRDMEKYKNKNINMALVVENIKVINTKKGEKMAFLEVNDDTGKTKAVIFPRNNDILNVIEDGKLILANVKVDERNGESQVIINEIKDDKN